MSKLCSITNTLVIYVSFPVRNSSSVSIQFHSSNFYLKLCFFPGSPFSELLGLRKDSTAVGFPLLCIFKLSLYTVHVCRDNILDGAHNTFWCA